jgi:hypothetical protein
MYDSHEARFRPSKKAWAGIILLAIAAGLVTLWVTSSMLKPSSDSVLDSCYVTACDTVKVGNTEVFQPTPSQLIAAEADAQKDQDLTNDAIALCVFAASAFGLYALVVGEKRKDARRRRDYDRITGHKQPGSNVVPLYCRRLGDPSLN